MDKHSDLPRKYKQMLIDETQEMSKEELAVIDNLMVRFHQMGWLEILEKHLKRQTAEKGTCGSCKYFIRIKGTRCGKCMKRKYLNDRWGYATDRLFIPSQSRKACVKNYEPKEA